MPHRAAIAAVLGMSACTWTSSLRDAVMGAADAPPVDARCREQGGGSTLCFAQVPGGTFLMGAQATDPAAPGYDPDAQPDEGPVRQVRVSPFWIHRAEVNVSVWEQCVAMKGCDASAVTVEGFSTWKGPGTGLRVPMPINNITWDGAVRLCAHLKGRLPTEAEWELAARGTDGRKWPWGNTPGCGVSATAGRTSGGVALGVDTMAMPPCDNLGPVSPNALTGASPYGLLGAAGNVWEWTSDWYAPTPAQGAATADPSGPAEGTRRVQRGGGWMSSEAADLRTTVRGSMAPDERASDVGVRCVWDPHAGSPDAP